MPEGSQHIHAEAERVLGGVADTITRHVLPPGVPANDPTTGATPPASPATEDRPSVHVELISGQLVEVPSPVAVVGQYEGLPLLGPIAQVDRRLNGWVKRVLDYGIFSPRLGEMLLIPLLQFKARPVAPDHVVLIGMGPPDHFSRNDLRFLYMNLTLAIKALGFEGFSVALANAPRYGLSFEIVIRSIFDGIHDAYERLRGAGGVAALGARVAPLRLVLVEADPGRYQVLERAVDAVQGRLPALAVVVTRRSPPAAVPAAADAEADQADPWDTRPDVPIIRFTISAPTAVGDQAPSALQPPGPAVTVAGPGPGGRSRRQVFQCSAVTETAVIPVREQEVEPYFVAQLPQRLVQARSLRELELFGALLATYLLPEDFLKLLDDDLPLVLALDATTAVFPWEMAAIRTHQGASFFGPDLCLTRQFRTRLAEAPGVAPPLNDRLDVLLIADPGPGRLSLAGAQREGLAVARALVLAQRAWGEHLDLNLAVRFGAMGEWDEGRVRDLFRTIPGMTDRVLDEARPCDPLEVLAMLLNNHYDVVHFAGHGIFDPATGRRGWVFGDDCTLTAKEIFKARQVPRLVFANACLSSAVEAGREPLPAVAIQQVSLAEAFFARGIENYIGAGWPVEDGGAETFATEFYLQALGIDVRSRETLELRGTAPPALISEALASARRLLLDVVRARTGTGGVCSLWGAYQHYGLVNAKLLPFQNRSVPHPGPGAG